MLVRQIAKMFIMASMGWLLVKTKVCESKDSGNISVVALYVVVPCMIISTFQIDYSRERSSGLLVVLIAALIIHIFLILFAGLSRNALRLSNIDALSIIYTNCGNMIIPIISSVLGKNYVIYATGFMVVQLVFIWTHCVSSVSGEKRFAPKRILYNINFISIIIAAALFFCHIKLPSILYEAVTVVGDMLAPINMICIGMTIAGMEAIKEKRTHILCVSAVRLLIIPLVLLPVFRLAAELIHIPDIKKILLVSYLGTIAPSAATIVQMAITFRGDVQEASAINAVSTLLCIFTIPLMVYLYLL